MPVSSPRAGCDERTLGGRCRAGRRSLSNRPRPLGQAAAAGAVPAARPRRRAPRGEEGPGGTRGSCGAHQRRDTGIEVVFIGRSSLHHGIPYRDWLGKEAGGFALRAASSSPSLTRRWRRGTRCRVWSRSRADTTSRTRGSRRCLQVDRCLHRPDGRRGAHPRDERGRDRPRR